MMVFILNIFLLCLLYEAEFSEIFQPVSLQMLKPGDSTTIQCYINGYRLNIVWYKFTDGKLQLVASCNSYYHHVAEERYSATYNRNTCNLSISGTSWDDVGIYYCGVVTYSPNNNMFGSGTFLMLTGSQTVSDPVNQLPQSQSIHSGDSLTISCSVHSQCTSEQSTVMWLKNSDHSAPERIYSSGNKSSDCQTTKRGERTCVFNLLMRNISSDDAGVYYCVVTSCGRVLFGNGTKLVFEDTGLSSITIALMLSNVILGIVTFILALILCRTQRKESPEAAEAAGGSAEGTQTSGELTFAALASSSRNNQGQSTVKHSGDSVIYSNTRYC